MTVTEDLSIFRAPDGDAAGLFPQFSMLGTLLGGRGGQPWEGLSGSPGLAWCPAVLWG